jgi:hypothetical protein
VILNILPSLGKNKIDKNNFKVRETVLKIDCVDRIGTLYTEMYVNGFPVTFYRKVMVRLGKWLSHI